MIRVGIITATRAEYGLLKPLYLELNNNSIVDCKLIVTGTHLSKKYGMTIYDIEKDNIDIYKKIKIINDDKNEDMSNIFSNSLLQFDTFFKKNKFDTIVLLGDRYETLAFAVAALFNNIQICHIHGGETTEGAIDEAIRHSITKMSYLHFTACEKYKMRVIQLGEDPKRVFNVGSLGIENILKIELLSKKELSKELGICLDKYFVVTYHPVTLKKDIQMQDFKNLLSILNDYQNYQIIFTKSNADKGGEIINKLIDDFVNHHDNAYSFYSLGTKRYLSLVKYSSAVVGNSSSGIIEVPALLVPTVNIGDRQRGRIKVKSIIDCKDDKKSIKKAINYAIKSKTTIKLTDIPFYKKNTSKLIANQIIKVFCKKVDLMKKFYDLKV